MRVPTIHMNGTSKSRLIDDLSEASSALRIALEAMGAAGPNARDYYPQGSAAFTEAADEHAARCRAVATVRSEIDAMIVAIDSGNVSAVSCA